MKKCVTNLKHELAKRGNFTSEEVINILKQLLNGYLSLYEKSIIYHNIIPQSILISYDSQGKPIYKISNFDFAKIYKIKISIMTKLGAPVYTAPELNCFVTDTDLDQALLSLEQIPKGKSQVDVYSIGITLYQFIFGQPPFETKHSDSLKVFLTNLKVYPFKIQDKSQYINGDLQEMIEKMIVYNPMTRIKFFEIYSNKFISIQTEQLVKCRQNINPKSKPDQQQGGFKSQFSFSPTPNVNPNLKATNPSPNTAPMYRFATYTPTNSDNIQQHSFKQSTAIQQQTQFTKTNQHPNR